MSKEGVKEGVSGLTGEEKSATIETNPLKRLGTQYAEFFRQRQEFIKAGYVRDYNELSQAFDDAFKKSYELFGSIEQGKTALDALRTSVSTFVFMGKDLRAELSENITVMQGLGFEASTLSEIVDNSVMGFGKNKEQIEDVMGDLVTLQEELRLPASQLAEDFKMAQETFAYSADQFKQNFTELQKLSRQTGLSFDTLTGAFGRSMDTFQGSSEMAGRLNQILGRSAFNSIDLLNMTEAQRAQTIRQQFQGRDPNQMGKFELLAVTEALGLGSVQATRRFLSTGKMEDAGKDSTGRDKMRDEVSKDIQLGGRTMQTALQSVADGIRKGQTPIQRGLIELGQSLSAAGRKFTEGSINVLLKEFGSPGMNKKTLEAFRGLTASQLQQFKMMLIADESFRKQFTDKLAESPAGKSTVITRQELVDMISAAEGKKDPSTSSSFREFAEKLQERQIENKKDLAAFSARLASIEATSKVVSLVGGKLGLNEQTAQLIAAQQAMGSKTLDLIEAKIRGDEATAKKLYKEIENSGNLIDKAADGLVDVAQKIGRVADGFETLKKALGL